MPEIMARSGVWLEHPWVVLASAQYLRLYAQILIVISYGLVTAYVVRQVRWTASIRRRIEEETNAQALFGNASVSGRIPTHQDSVANQLDELKRRPVKRLKKLAARAVLLGIVGIGIPLTVLSLTGRYYSFMFPGAQPLGGSEVRTRTSDPNLVEFAIEQLYLSAPGDALEIFFDGNSNVSFDRKQKFFTFAVLINRILCESSIAALTFLLTYGTFSAGRLSKAEAKRIQDLSK